MALAHAVESKTEAAYRLADLLKSGVVSWTLGLRSVVKLYHVGK